MKRASAGICILLFSATGLAAQDAARADYFRSVASFFNLPANEVAILSDWEIAPAEIPVVLFVARRAGSQQAAKATIVRSTGPARKVTGSRASTLNSSDSMTKN